MLSPFGKYLAKTTHYQMPAPMHTAAHYILPIYNVINHYRSDAAFMNLLIL